VTMVFLVRLAYLVLQEWTVVMSHCQPCQTFHALSAQQDHLDNEGIKVSEVQSELKVSTEVQEDQETKVIMVHQELQDLKEKED